MRRPGLWLSLVAVGVAVVWWVFGRNPERDVRACAPGEICLEIDADGVLTIRELGQDPLVLGPLAREDHPRSTATLQALRDELARRTRDPTGREPSGDWGRVVHLAAAETTPWYRAGWIFQVADRAGVSRMRLALPWQAEGVLWELPRSGSIGSDLPAAFVQVRLPGRASVAGVSGRSAARILLGSENDVGSRRERLESVDVPTLEALGEWIRQHREQVQGRMGEVETPTPAGADVRFGDVLVAMRHLVDAGVAEIQLTGAPLPLPRATTDPRR